MNEPDLLMQQRAALRALRRAEARRARAEEQAETQRRTETQAAQNARDNTRQRAAELLEKTQERMKEARARLQEVDLAYLLDKAKAAAPVASAAADPLAELIRWAGKGKQAAGKLDVTVKELIQWREARARLKWTLAFAALMIALVFLVEAWFLRSYGF